MALFKQSNKNSDPNSTDLSNNQDSHHNHESKSNIKINTPSQSDSPNSNDPELPDSDPNIIKRNNVLSSIRNKANKIAQSSTRKLRNLSKASPNNDNSIDTKTPQKNGTNADTYNTHKKKLNFSKIKLNKPFFNRKQSKSNPSTPQHSDDNDSHLKPENINIIATKSSNLSKPVTPVKKSNIVIGATYSHSDNEIVDNTLQKIHKRRRELQQNKKHKLFKRRSPPKNGSDLHLNNGNVTEEKQQNLDTKNIENDDMNGIRFQFLKNVEVTKQSINNFMAKQKSKVISKKENINLKKNNNYLKAIPQKSLELWKKSQEYEVNRFAKMSSQATYKPFHGTDKCDYFENSESISWEKRIMTDIIRAGKLFVCGEVNEIFEFPSFKSTNEKQELVRTTIRYLESAVTETITQLLSQKSVDRKLNKDAAKEISVKCVRQALISLCQDFVNDPYFKHLKESCEQFGLQPTDIGLIGSQEVQSIKSWTPRLCINITGNRIYTHIVRVFQCYELSGIEAIETQIYFGFKRTFSIDCLGGPPIILPPIFLSHDKGKQIAYQISIPKEKIKENMYLDIPIPKAGDFIPKKDD